MKPLGRSFSGMGCSIISTAFSYTSPPFAGQGILLQWWPNGWRLWGSGWKGTDFNSILVNGVTLSFWSLKVSWYDIFDSVWSCASPGSADALFGHPPWFTALTQVTSGSHDCGGFVQICFVHQLCCWGWSTGFFLFLVLILVSFSWIFGW